MQGGGPNLISGGPVKLTPLVQNLSLEPYYHFPPLTSAVAVFAVGFFLPSFFPWYSLREPVTRAPSIVAMKKNYRQSVDTL
jgi:hypothetical protein